MGVDRAGIVAKFARCLADHGVNIVEMHAHSRPEPESGTPIYSMHMTLDVPKPTDTQTLAQRLHSVGDALQVEITFD